MKKLGAGFVLSCVSAVLALAAAIVNFSIMYPITIASVLLIIPFVLTLVVFLTGKKGRIGALADILPTLNAVLAIAGGVYGAKNMVAQCGYVVAGLDGIDTIMTFIIMEVLVVVAFLIALVSSFISQTKESQITVEG